jgi:hypothetical protein
MEKRWEYLVLRGKISEGELNERGDEGWEVVQVVFNPDEDPPYTIILKKPKS